MGEEEENRNGKARVDDGRRVAEEGEGESGDEEAGR